MIQRYAAVVLLHPSFVHKDRVFTYEVPTDVEASVGNVVRVPFGRTRTTGVVTQVMTVSDVDKTVPLLATLGPGIGTDGVTLARWLADRYLSSFGEALAAVVPERVAGVEKQQAIPPPPAADADVSWLDGWENAGALLSSINDATYAGFSLQPLGDAGRAPMLVSLAQAAVKAGRRALILVPEVRIHSGVVDALHSAFGDALAWLGADHSPRERYRAWLAARRGEALIVAGGRSAVLAPIPNLGLVIVDDESHHTYKERRAPRFHARTVAAERARTAGATLVVVGVPPSIEVAAAVKSRAMTAVSPSRRAQMERRPPVHVIDLAKDPDRRVPSGRMLSTAQAAMQHNGRVVILTHKAGEEMDKVLARTARVLKPAESARLDAKSGESAIKRALAHAQLIVATPVIAKDLAFGKVDLLGIVYADAALSQPDFRAAEETFSTWWRIARFAQSVAIETAQSESSAITSLIRFDPAALAASEMTRRKEAGYPPFGGLAKITSSLQDADGIAKMLEQKGGSILGPVQRGSLSVIAVKAGSRAQLERLLASVAEGWRAEDAPLRIDIDPRTIV